MNLGKDGRELSYYQSADWLKKILKNRKYLSQPKGEKHWGVKITKDVAKEIQQLKVLTREMAASYAKKYGLHPMYPYHIKAKRRWKHI